MTAGTRGLSLADPAPSYELVDTEGRSWSVAGDEGNAATVIVFTCNHCPYAIAWHDRILDAARDYANRGVVRFLAIQRQRRRALPATPTGACRSGSPARTGCFLPAR